MISNRIIVPKTGIDYFKDITLKKFNFIKTVMKFSIILELDLIRYTRFLYTPYVYIWYQFDIPACIRYSAGDPNSGMEISKFFIL